MKGGTQYRIEVKRFGVVHEGTTDDASERGLGADTNAPREVSCLRGSGARREQSEGEQWEDQLGRVSQARTLVSRADSSSFKADIRELFALANEARQQQAAAP